MIMREAMERSHSSHEDEANEDKYIFSNCGAMVKLFVQDSEECTIQENSRGQRQQYTLNQVRVSVISTLIDTKSYLIIK